MIIINNSLKYNNQEVRDIIHLLKLYNFTPNHLFIVKKEQENTKLTTKQVRLWASITGMGNKMMKIWN